jgi:hypothetical protein
LLESKKEKERKRKKNKKETTLYAVEQDERLIR